MIGRTTNDRRRTVVVIETCCRGRCHTTIGSVFALALIFLLFDTPPPAATAASYSRYVTIAIPNPQPIPPTLNFPGAVANFGTRFEFNRTLDVDLFLPPGSKYLCGGYPSDYPTRKLKGTSDGRGAPEGENREEEGVTGGAEEWEEPHVEDWLAHIPTLPMTSDRRDDEDSSRRRETAFDDYPSTYSNRPIALLVSRGLCPFELKARAAIDLNKKLGPSPDDATARHRDRRIKYVIVYNDDPSMGESLVTMGGSSSARSLDVGMIFVSKNSGSVIESSIRAFQSVRTNPILSGADYRIPFQDETIGAGLWTFPSVLATPEEPTPYNRDRNGSDEDNSRSTRGGGGGGSNSFYWIRFVLFSLLIAAPCARVSCLWYQAGGQVRFRRDEETGRIRGLEVIRPPPRWYRGRMENMTMGGHAADGDGRATEGRGKLTKDQVMELPEIEYRATDEGGKVGTDGAATKAGATATSSGGSGLTPSFSVVPDPEASAPPESALPAPIPVPTQGDTNENGAATSCTSCSICIEDFEEGEKLRFLPKCKHAFHTECIMPWLTERQGCCPLCKTSVLGDDDDETDKEAEGGDDGERGGDNVGTQTDIEMGTVTTAMGTVRGGQDDGERDNVRSVGEGGQ